LAHYGPDWRRMPLFYDFALSDLKLTRLRLIINP